ncbi:putative FAD dependent oxidoreductase [Cadophora sp. MPI-SDFR-AT-0126]|nr:putative FAD dependent oxidoreductase [Leotiomycetes sp. MPI-SDFR-AT-0126]
MDVPVLIIGAGPSGATTALHLARMGVKALVISRHRGSANTPRAHIFNQRAMEVLRDAEIEGLLSSVASPAHDMQHTSWLHTLAGEEYGRLWAWGNKPSQKGDYESSSPCVMSDLPQSFLEPVLVDEVRKLGSEVRFSTEFVEFEETEDGVRTTLRDRATQKTFVIISGYLVGADGARSAVLDALKIPIVGKQLNTAFNVHIKADLTKYIAHRPGSLNWILNPDAPDWSAVGNFRMVRPWNEFVVSLHPATKDGKAFTPTENQILERLYQMIGDYSIKIEILSSFQWKINDQVAERWQQGRVLCIGDATHRHPPINGLGSNTCLSDAFNLAWKLAYVIKGYAAPSLLDTLTLERKPVGDAIVKRANAGMEAHRLLWDLMGLTPQARQGVVQKLQEASDQGAEMREKLRLALEATDDEVQALGIQMNQVYLNSPAVVVEDGDTPPDFSSLNFLKDVMLSTFPGYHLPHVWLAADGQSERVSSLDLAGHGIFTLFTGIGGGAWLKAAEAISSRSGVQVKGYSIGFRCGYMDCYREWIHLRGVEETGAVLVRPDHFVAWRCKELPENCPEKLATVLSKLLGKNV